MDQQPSIDYTAEEGDTGILTKTYRHDVHKFLGTPHGDAPELFAGVPANQSVPFGADSDAANLSRPDGNPSPTVDNHETPYRLSLVDGESWYDPDNSAESGLSRLYRASSPNPMPKASTRRG